MSIGNLVIDNTLVHWVILPGLIFIFRLFDVPLGTMRIIFVSRGRRFLAAFLGFFEVLIWLVAITQIMANLDNVFCFVAYAGGFAMGNFVGILIEEKLALGNLVVKTVLIDDEHQLKERLAAAGFGVTSIHAHGRSGEVELIYTVIKRKDLDKVIDIIEACQSNAFYSVEDVKWVNQGIFPSKKPCAPIAAREPEPEASKATPQPVEEKEPALSPSRNPSA